MDAELSRVIVLLVDDTEAQRNAIRAMLERAGFTVRTATTGAEALAAVGEQPPQLVLLELRLPDIDGFHLALKLRADPRTSGVPIVFYSAGGSPAETGVDRELGSFLTVPFQAADLLLALKGTLARAAASNDDQSSPSPMNSSRTVR